MFSPFRASEHYIKGVFDDKQFQRPPVYIDTHLSNANSAGTLQRQKITGTCMDAHGRSRMARPLRSTRERCVESIYRHHV